MLALRAMSSGCPVVFCIPLGEGAEALAERCGGAEAEVLFQRRRVGIGDGHVAGLHAHKLAMTFEVVIFWQDACADQLTRGLRAAQAAEGDVYLPVPVNVRSMSF